MGNLADADQSPESGTTNSMKGGSAQNVVQAGTISGGVHFHPVAPAPSARSAVPGGGGAPLHFAPPVEFVGRRQELTTLLDALRNPHIPLITLRGMGGIGKTALAEQALRAVADEGIFSTTFWASAQAEKFVGESVLRTETAGYTFDTLLSDLLRHSPMASSAEAPAEVRAEIVTRWLAGDRVLIVLDNLETVADRDALVAALVEILGRGTILVTSRYAIVHPRAFTLELEGLSPRDGVDFLTSTAARQNNRNLGNADDDTLARIRDTAGGAPLAMLLISGQMDYQPVDQVLRVIEEAGFNDLSYEFYSFVFRRTWNELAAPARKVLVAMRHFEGKPTAEAIEYTVDMTDDEFYPAATMLVRRSMLAVALGSEVRYSLHPLTRYFVNTDIASRWQ